MTFVAVLATEIIKLRRTKMLPLSWLAFSAMPIAVGLFTWIVKEPDRAAGLGLLGQKAQLATLRADWSSYFALLLQATGIGGMILASVIASYVFGREHAEGTAKNLLTLPVERRWFVLAKLVVVLLWFAALMLALVTEGIAVCVALGLPGYTANALSSGVVDIFVAAAVVSLLVPVVAWVALVGEGYLAPLGFTIFMLVLGNVLGATGWGKWFPWSIVPLFAGVAGPRSDTLAASSAWVLALTFVAGLWASMRRLSFADNTQ